MPNDTTDASTPQQEEDTAAKVLATPTDEIVKLMNTTTTPERAEDPKEVKESSGTVVKAFDEARKSIPNFLGLLPLIDLLSTFPYFSQTASPPSLMYPPSR